MGGGGPDGILPSVVKTDDGGFIVSINTSAATNTGNIDSFCSFTNKRAIFVKYNQDASVAEWSKCYGSKDDSVFQYFFPTNNGGMVLGGLFKSSVSWGWLITKYDETGSLLWQRNYSKGNGSILRSMMATDDGGFIMLGESHRTDTNVSVHYGTWETFDFWVLKVDSNGYKVWSKVIGGSSDEAAFALAPAPGNGCYIIGATQSSDHDCTGYHGGGQDGYLARLDVEGNMLWHKCLGGSGYEAGYPIGYGVSDGKGGVLMTVSTTSEDGDVHHHKHEADYWALNVDSSGSIVWENCYDGGGTEYPSAICKATDGSVWINGWTYKNYEDVFLVHADSTGNLLQSVILTGNNQDRGTLLYPLNEGLVLAGGTYYEKSGSFSPLHNYGIIDVFLTTFAPWPTGVANTANADKEFEIYPNPAKGLLHIKGKNVTGIYKVRLNSIEGKRVYAGEMKPGNSEVVIDVSNMAKGIYYVEWINGTGGKSIEKVVIE